MAARLRSPAAAWPQANSPVLYPAAVSTPLPAIALASRPGSGARLPRACLANRCQ